MSNKTDLQRNNVILGDTPNGLIGGVSRIESALEKKNVSVEKAGTYATFSELETAINDKVTDTYDADATANDIASGKTAYVKGKKLIGNGKIEQEITAGIFEHDFFKDYGTFTSSSGHAFLYPTSYNTSSEQKVIDGIYYISAKDKGFVKKLDVQFSSGEIIFYEDKNSNIFVAITQTKCIYKFNSSSEEFELVWDGINDPSVGKNVFNYYYCSFLEVDGINTMFCIASSSSGYNQDTTAILVYNNDTNKFVWHRINYYNREYDDLTGSGGKEDIKAIHTENEKVFFSTSCRCCVYNTISDTFTTFYYGQSISCKIQKTNNLVFMIPTGSNTVKYIISYNLTTNQIKKYTVEFGTGDSIVFNDTLYVFAFKGSVYKYVVDNDEFVEMNKSFDDVNADKSRSLTNNQFLEIDGDTLLLFFYNTYGTPAKTYAIKVTSSELILISDSLLLTRYSPKSDTNTTYLDYNDGFVYLTSVFINGTFDSNYINNSSIYKYNKNTSSFVCAEKTEEGKVNCVWLYKDLNGNYYSIPFYNNYGNSYIYKYNTETKLFDIQITTENQRKVYKIISNNDYPNILIFWVGRYIYAFDTITNTTKKQSYVNLRDFGANYVLKDNVLYLSCVYKDSNEFVQNYNKYKNYYVGKDDSRYRSYISNFSIDGYYNGYVFNYATNSFSQIKHDGFPRGDLQGFCYYEENNEVYCKINNLDTIKKIENISGTLTLIDTNIYSMPNKANSFGFYYNTFNTGSTNSVFHKNKPVLYFTSSTQLRGGFTNLFGDKMILIESPKSVYSPIKALCVWNIINEETNE